MEVAVIGMGALGSAFAHVVRQAGIDVVGIDTDADVRSAIEMGEPPTDSDIAEAFDPMPMTDEHRRALEADAAFIFVSTPGYDPDNVTDVVEAIGPAWPEYPVVICSTVPPGATSTVASKTDATVLYNPEFVARGKLLEGFTQPAPFIIGAPAGVEPIVGQIVQLWQRIANPAPVASMAYESAEIAKLAFNTFTAIKMSWANQVALAAARHGANGHTILNVIRDDPRIGGPENLRPGLGFGGPCLPDDINAYHEHVSGGRDRLATAADRVNDDVADAVVVHIIDTTAEDARVGCLGTAYKPGAGVTTGSEAVRVADALRVHRAVRTYDPMAPSDVDRLDDLIGWADVLVKLVPWPEFDGIDQPMIDCWDPRPGRQTLGIDLPSPDAERR